jgi:hypothetical protein
LKAESFLYPERTAAFEELRRSLQSRERGGQKMKAIGMKINSGMKMPSETGSSEEHPVLPDIVPPKISAA